MKQLITVGFFVFTSLSFSQESCDCQEELDFVVNYYEKNLPGFKDNVTKKTKSYYKGLKEKLVKTANTSSNKLQCFKVLTQYVEFFKDNHSSIRMPIPKVNEEDVESLEHFLSSDIITSKEAIELTEADKKQYPLTDIRGLYQTKDGTYTIAVIPNKTPLRDYVGVIVDSKTKLWKKGQVKLEFKKKSNSNLYEAFVYLRKHNLQYVHNFTFSNGILGGNWFKTSKEHKIHHATDIDYNYDFKILNDSISYLRIPTFSSDRSAKIDSLYKVAFPKIRQTPYLIIDVRNNGGGSDNNVHPLLEFIYTNKIKRDKVDLYVTPDNIKVWEQWYEDAKEDPENYSQDDLDWFENEITKQKKAKPYTFIPRSKGGNMIRNYNPNAVKKVAIIQNRYSGSSCETLLFWALQSEKTMLVGENSGGYVGYGEIGAVPTPCFKFRLGCTMTRYRSQRKYEADGIPPKHYLSNNSDWVEQTISLLSEN